VGYWGDDGAGSFRQQQCPPRVRGMIRKVVGVVGGLLVLHTISQWQIINGGPGVVARAVTIKAGAMTKWTPRSCLKGAV